MSKISGHFEITNAALQQIRTECAGNAMAGAIPATPEGSRFGWSDVGHFVGGSGFLLLPAGTPSPSHGAVLRDLLDVYNLGHWSNHAQKHHFMRRFDGQSSRAAYVAACEWIRSEASLAAMALQGNLARGRGTVGPFTAGDGACPLPGASQGAGSGANVFTGAASDHLGNAVHALQDSFSASHVEREGLSAGDPGAIAKLFVYQGHEKEHHSDHDHGWDAADGFSVTGQQAIAATKALIALVIESAVSARPLGAAWERFVARWLRTSDKLDSQREDVTDAFVRRFEKRRPAGKAGSVRYLDATALADALLREYATNAEGIYRVIRRVDDLWEDDSDNVAERYVLGLQAAGPAAAAVLKGHPLLIGELIRVLDSGVVFPGERAAIAFLRGLR